MSFLSTFLSERQQGIRTGCAHRPVAARFEVTGSSQTTEFIVKFDNEQATIDTSGIIETDYTITCTEEELKAIVDGKLEFLGQFWTNHLPLDFSWAPSLYAFFFPKHEYLHLTPVLQEIYKNPKFYPTITPFTQGYILHNLVREQKLRLTLEVGLAWGGSALFISEAHKREGNGHHFAVDPYQSILFNNQAIKFIEKAELQPFFTCLQIKAQPAMRGFALATLQFDLVYIDGDHSIPAVLSDFLFANSILRVGGFLAFDDSHWPSGRSVLATIQKHFPYRVIERHSTDRLTILKKERHSNGPLSVRLTASVGRAFISFKDLLKSLRDKALPDRVSSI